LIQVEDPQSSDSDMDGVYECISKNQLFISTCMHSIIAIISGFFTDEINQKLKKGKRKIT
jgi:hypothetical protein